MVSRYVLMILIAIMIHSGVYASQLSDKSVDSNHLLKHNIGDMKYDDLKRAKGALSHQWLMEKREWTDQHEQDMDCCLGCLGLAPFVVGLYCDVSNMSPSIYGIPLGKVLGAVVGGVAMVHFDNEDYPPQTETAKKLALVQQELQNRKNIKID